MDLLHSVSYEHYTTFLSGREPFKYGQHQIQGSFMILQARDDCGNPGFLPCPLDAVKGIHRRIGFQVSQDLLKLRKRDDTSSKGPPGLAQPKG